MKTERLLLALAAIAMAGCAQNEIIETAPKADRSIRFDVYTGVQTKGTETTTTSIKTLNFGILGYKTSSAGWTAEGASATPAMYNEQVTYDNSASKWGYTNIKYWPTNDDKLSFFAYAPYDDASTDMGIELSASTQAGAPEITFTQKAAAADLVDLVVAEKKDLTYNTTAGADNKIGFTFNHVLTKIDVQAQQKADYGDTKIYITGLKLKSDAKLYKKATYKMSDGNWDYTTPAKAEAWGANASLDLDGMLDKSNTALWGYAAGKGKLLSAPTVDEPTPIDAVFSGTGADKHFLYMIPVANSTGLTTKGDAKLEVTYDIVVKVSDSRHAVSTTTKTVDLPAGAFKKATFTTYTLKIGLNAIEIGDVEVNTNWTTASGELDVK